MANSSPHNPNSVYYHGYPKLQLVATVGLWISCSSIMITFVSSSPSLSSSTSLDYCYSSPIISSIRGGSSDRGYPRNYYHNGHIRNDGGSSYNSGGGRYDQHRANNRRPRRSLEQHRRHHRHYRSRRNQFDDNYDEEDEEDDIFSFFKQQEEQEKEEQIISALNGDYDHNSNSHNDDIEHDRHYNYGNIYDDGDQYYTSYYDDEFDHESLYNREAEAEQEYRHHHRDGRREVGQNYPYEDSFRTKREKQLTPDENSIPRRTNHHADSRNNIARKTTANSKNDASAHISRTSVEDSYRERKADTKGNIGGQSQKSPLPTANSSPTRANNEDRQVGGYQSKTKVNGNNMNTPVSVTQHTPKFEQKVQNNSRDDANTKTSIDRESDVPNQRQQELNSSLQPSNRQQHQQQQNSSPIQTTTLFQSPSSVTATSSSSSTTTATAATITKNTQSDNLDKSTFQRETRSLLNNEPPKQSVPTATSTSSSTSTTTSTTSTTNVMMNQLPLSSSSSSIKATSSTSVLTSKSVLNKTGSSDNILHRKDSEGDTKSPSNLSFLTRNLNFKRRKKDLGNNGFGGGGKDKKDLQMKSPVVSPSMSISSLNGGKEFPTNRGHASSPSNTSFTPPSQVRHHASHLPPQSSSSNVRQTNEQIVRASTVTRNNNSQGTALAQGQQQQQQQLPSRVSPSVKQQQPPQKPQKRSLPTTMAMTTPWARKFILSRPKDHLLPIPREFLSDGFNLVQLAPIVEQVALRDSGDGEEQQQYHPSLYKSALRLILNSNESSLQNVTSSSAAESLSQKQVQKAAEVLYQLLHERYICSPRGLDTVRRMMTRRANGKTGNGSSNNGPEAIFGRCPRVNCNGMPLLPYGMSDTYDINGDNGMLGKGMRYCCCCGEGFHLWESKVDGCAWGPYFCHLLVMTHGAEIFPWLRKKAIAGETKIDLHMKRSNDKIDDATDSDDKGKPTPKIFGFRIHPDAPMQYPTR